MCFINGEFYKENWICSLLEKNYAVSLIWLGPNSDQIYQFWYLSIYQLLTLALCSLLTPIKVSMISLISKALVYVGFALKLNIDLSCSVMSLMPVSCDKPDCLLVAVQRILISEIDFPRHRLAHLILSELMISWNGQHSHWIYKPKSLGPRGCDKIKDKALSWTIKCLPQVRNRINP